MNFVKPYIEIINEPDLFKRIELAGRTCYKSHDKITDESAYPFFQRMVKSGHLSVVEHSNVIVRTYSALAAAQLLSCIMEYTEKTGRPSYIRFSPLFPGAEFVHVDCYGYTVGDDYIFSGNIRAWRDIISMFFGESVLIGLFHDHPAFADIFETHNKICDFEFEDAEVIDSVDGIDKMFRISIEDLHKIITVKVVADRGLIDEFRTHRQHSFSVESTRYCDYDGECQYCYPFWYDSDDETEMYKAFEDACLDSEYHYKNIRSIPKGVPQVARGALNLWVKSEAVITATVASWKCFLALRSSPAAHPESQKICKMIKEATGL